MATKRHSDDDEIQPATAGGKVAQSIVELLSASSSGLVFWSRHPFEVAAEVQLRVQLDALPAEKPSSIVDATDGWVMKRAFVVHCKPARRTNGSVGFQVSVLFVPPGLLSDTQPDQARAMTSWGCELDPALIRRLTGLN